MAKLGKDRPYQWAARAGVGSTSAVSTARCRSATEPWFMCAVTDPHGQQWGDLTLTGVFRPGAWGNRAVAGQVSGDRWWRAGVGGGPLALRSPSRRDGADR